MKLSVLQKFIVLEAYGQKKTDRRIFAGFYAKQKKSPSKKDLVNVITKSLERLIDKGLMVGFGQRTKDKWFIKEVALTPLGRRVTKKILGEQRQLPFKKARKPIIKN
ncbi:MAG: hypothetical protein UV78_C0030G0007 [Parcubacteria group bacterium GW2011_GWA2_43_17]|nr:MAG: hypothetical protein UV78_C0030G0007 [Parcubacteria group bacterium GW2011_GWA2_43_17]KKT92872.1 MAG: hypothetical protein UW91_C0015G0043 [Parcubacteria group bacterium GW2011_GWF2_45_11]KKT96904.1 MAG: hypothetical protein UW98_C0031G0003 [Parcubacteria group bacterium GW2011_GWC2_45_15]OGY93280.1 MAG: hypothetical protein A2260_02885 [Candidatus Komeilibacteria bacterium RIFOXYA2_FULL_45_9]OGY95921.1 MAG: hypothetical protein A3J95_00390 [Candidatus Komeilibacteria bacterium RIFOXYC2